MIILLNFAINSMSQQHCLAIMWCDVDEWDEHLW